MRDGLTITQVAKQTDLSLHTLRYYERIGLIPGIRRAANGHRRYAQDDLTWIEFLKRLRATGMPTSAMKRFAALRRQGKTTIEQRHTLLTDHYQKVVEHITTLERNLEAIRAKITLLEQQKEQP